MKSGVGVTFLSRVDTDLYVEAVKSGTATLIYRYVGTDGAVGINCAASLKLTAWELELRSVVLDTNGMPSVIGGNIVPGERIPQGDELSTYVPFNGGGAPAIASTSPRWVTFTVVTNVVTNCATLSMTQEYAEGFKVWDMAFEGVTTNGSSAYFWQGESNAFLRAECPTNATGATLPLALSMFDIDFEGLTNEVQEAFSLYRHEQTDGFWGSTYSITEPRADIGMPAFSSQRIRRACAAHGIRKKRVPCLPCFRACHP